MPRALIAALALAACTDDPPPDPGPGVTSQITTFEYFAKPPHKLDVLIVVDNTPAMAPYQDQLDEIANAAGEALSNVGGGFPDVRVLVQSLGSVSPLLEFSTGLDFVHHASFAGTLGDALTPLLHVGTAETAPNQPLAVMDSALSGSALLRPNALLGVVLISASDDASPRSDADYAASIGAHYPYLENVAVSGIYLRPAPKLDAFVARFPDRSFTSLDAADHVPALALFGQLFKTTLEGTCVEELPLDLDPQTPGDQWGCSVIAVFDGLEHVVPRCAGDGPIPCWDITRESNEGCPPEGGQFILKGWTWAVRPLIRGQCVVK